MNGSEVTAGDHNNNNDDNNDNDSHAEADSLQSPWRAYSPRSAVRPDLLAMEPYVPILPYEVLARKLGRAPDDIVKLDANENPYGPSPQVPRALAAAPYLHVYPDPESRELRAALAEYCGVASEYLLVGHGADELIDLLLRLVVEPGRGDCIVNTPPTFGMYKFDANVNGARIVNAWRRAEDAFRVPVAAIEALFAERGTAATPAAATTAVAEAAETAQLPKIVFVTSPNNPDGSVLSDDDLKRLLALPTLVVLDEAYYEFAADDDNDDDGAAVTRSRATRIDWVPHYSNLVVLRTFSKWAALAGLRVGYGAFPPALAEHLWKIKQPYNVNVAAQIAAAVSLADRADLLAKVDRLRAERARFYGRLAQQPHLASLLHAYPSQSNFVLCRVLDAGGVGVTAVQLRDFLAERGVLIRYYNTAGLTQCIRVSMGTPAQMDRLYEALDEFAAACQRRRASTAPAAAGGYGDGGDDDTGGDDGDGAAAVSASRRVDHVMVGEAMDASGSASANDAA